MNLNASNVGLSVIEARELIYTKEKRTFYLPRGPEKGSSPLAGSNFCRVYGAWVWYPDPV
jgi:hypothetical protein